MRANHYHPLQNYHLQNLQPQCFILLVLIPLSLPAPSFFPSLASSFSLPSSHSPSPSSPSLPPSSPSPSLSLPPSFTPSPSLPPSFTPSPSLPPSLPPSPLPPSLPPPSLPPSLPHLSPSPSLPPEYISHMDIFMSLLQLLRQAPLPERNTICQLVNSILHHTPEDIQHISSVPGWEIMFFWLLTPFVPDVEHQPRRPHLPTTIVMGDASVEQPATPTEQDISSQPGGVKTTPPKTLPLHSASSKTNHLTPTPSPHSLKRAALHSGNLDSTGTSPQGSAMPPSPRLQPPATPPSPRLQGSATPPRTRPQTSATPSTPHSQSLASPSDTVSPNHTPSEAEQVEDSMSPDAMPRTRSSAFVDETTAAGLKYVITHDKELVRKDRKRSLHVSTPWCMSTPALGQEEVSRTVDIIAQTFRHILWNSTIDQTPWKVCT